MDILKAIKAELFPETEKTVLRNDTRRILFVKTGCPYCAAALKALEHIKASVYVPYDRRIEVKYVDQSPSAAAECVQILKYAGYNGLNVPLLVYEGVMCSGVYTSGGYEAFLLRLMGI